MKRKTISLVFLILFLVFPVFAERVAMPALAMPTAASNGFGGTHVAYTDNVYSLLVNPAAMIRVQQRSFFNLAPSLLSPQTTVELSKSIVDLAKGDTDTLGSMANALSRQKGKIALGMELREFPLSFAWVANGFGVGLWNRVFVNANVIGTNVDADIYGDVMLPVGFAFKILALENHSVDAGVTVKPFARVRAKESERITNLMDNTSDFIDNINVPLILGGGFDLGFLYRWTGGLQAGLTFDDIFSRGTVIHDIKGNDPNSYYIPFTMNLGLSYGFNIAFLGVTVAADWHDITNAFNQDDYLNHRNVALDFGLGLQVSLFDIFLVRIGMNEMLPAFGIGFDLGPCKIDLAYYGREFGKEPGQLSVATFDLSIAIRPGAEKRDWPWTRRSLAGLFTGE